MMAPSRIGWPNPNDRESLQGPACPFYAEAGNDGHAHWVLDAILQGSYARCPICHRQVKLF